MDSKALSDWATAVVSKTPFVDVDTPPNGKEWERILKPKAHGNSGSFDTPQQFNQPPIHNHIHLPSRSPRRSPRRHASSPSYHRYSYTPTRTPPRRRFEHTPSSPIVLEHESWVEFDGDGLRAFIAHCESKFKVGNGTGFQEAYLKLRDEEIQPDVMRGKKVEWYEAKGIKSGIAERIAGSFNKWYSRLMQDI